MNFNALSCRDLDAAKQFYGAVFGWTALDLGTGLYWAMTAYGDYLETITPGVRERAAAFGAPGFADVLAAITPIGDDPPPPTGTSPSLSMTPTRRRQKRWTSAAPW